MASAPTFYNRVGKAIKVPLLNSSLSVLSVPTKIGIKRHKRALEKTCPICKEKMSVRLLASHAVLESRRVKMFIDNLGSLEVLPMDFEVTPLSRHAALKARKKIYACCKGSPGDSLQKAEKIIYDIKRQRRRRFAKFREMFQEGQKIDSKIGRIKRTKAGITCPICQLRVYGSYEVADTHINACIAKETRKSEEMGQRRASDSILNIRDNVVGGSVTRRSHTLLIGKDDVDDELDVEGDEGYGEPQFTEGDVLPVEHLRQTRNAELGEEFTSESEDEVPLRTLRHLVSNKEVSWSFNEGMRLHKVLTDESTNSTKDENEITGEHKMRHQDSTNHTSVLCRVCLHSYDEPTISTGCWHTCCKECWLRCLGSSKLCPFCKRITSATDLRRIFL